MLHNDVKNGGQVLCSKRENWHRAVRRVNKHGRGAAWDHLNFWPNAAYCATVREKAKRCTIFCGIWLKMKEAHA